VNEHQYFARVFSEVSFVLSFEGAAGLDERVIERVELRQLLSHPRLGEVIDQAREEIADSLFFHASELNQVIYNHSWQQVSEENKRKREEEKKEEGNAPIHQRVIKKATGIIGSLGGIADDRLIYPANSVIFALLVILIIYMLSS
jgi:hypothetical protein